MKMFLIAVALASAAPAVAQTAAPADPHADHAEHSANQAHGQHTGHGDAATHSGQADPHAEGAMAECCRGDADQRMACCEGMASGNGRDCCAEQAQEGQTTDPHAAHDMSGGAHAGHGSNQD